jgi:hypothetical protein
MSDPKRRKAFEAKYDEFLLSEDLIEAMGTRRVSMCALSKRTGIPIHRLHGITSSGIGDITMSELCSILRVLDYSIKYSKRQEA